VDVDIFGFTVLFVYLLNFNCGLFFRIFQSLMRFSYEEQRSNLPTSVPEQRLEVGCP